MTAKAAERVGPGGKVIAIDASGRCLRQASTTLTLAGVRNRVTLLQGDMCLLDGLAELNQARSKGFDRIMMLCTFHLLDPDVRIHLLQQLAGYLAPDGWIVFDQENEEREIACLDALPFDGSNPAERHLFFGDARGFKNTRKRVREQAHNANLEVVKVEDCHRSAEHICKYEVSKMVTGIYPSHNRFALNLSLATLLSLAPPGCDFQSCQKPYPDYWQTLLLPKLYRLTDYPGQQARLLKLRALLSSRKTGNNEEV